MGEPNVGANRKNSGTDQVDLSRVRAERDFYRTLLELGKADDVGTFLSRALDLVIDFTGAVKGYIELHGDDEQAEPSPKWSLARGWSQGELERVREDLSRGVIAEAIATGRTVSTGRATDDPRFRDRRSVREKRIEAVLCAPIGLGPPLGVIYLQDRREVGPFSEEHVARVETFAEHLSPYTDRLLIRSEKTRALDATLDVRKVLRLEGFIGRSPAIADALRQVSLVAPLEVNALLTGPSGTGKTQLARVIHESSPRASGPFIELNCAAFPENLLESELFGALPGAHSTATRKIDGKVGAAEGGTLFLDDVGELSLSLQPKLLQLLQSRTYYPLGSTKALTANVRIIAATNVDLKRAVTDKRFREDLFYRLQVLPIRVPSLAERRDDIPELVRFFSAQAAATLDLPHVEPSAQALRAAVAAEWPGNVRQLAHAVQAAVITAAGSSLLQFEPAHLGLEPTSAPGSERTELSFQQLTFRFQGRILKDTLERTGWNVVETAERLDLTRSHVYNLIRSHGLERP